MTQFINTLSRIFQRGPSKETVDALASGLISRSGASEFDKFKRRIKIHAPELFHAVRSAQENNNFANVPAKVDAFLEKTLDIDIVDEDFPACRDGGMFKNNCAPVRMLQSLSNMYVKDNEFASELMHVLVEIEPENYRYWAAYAHLLLKEEKFREATNAALSARRLKEYDFFINHVVNTTQKSLLDNGFTPDLYVNTFDYRERFCAAPFQCMRVLAHDDTNNVSTFICYAGAWLPIAAEQDKSWNSEELQYIRESILDGSFKYCDSSRCIFLRNNTLPLKTKIKDEYLRQIIDNNLTLLPKGPSKLHLAYDRSCNLTCPSCRNQPYIADRNTTKELDAMFDSLLAPLLPSVTELLISLSGEALASRHSMRVLKFLTPEKYPNLKVHLHTNMALISLRKWKELGASADCIKELSMSIDGATPATLEKLRRGLKWNRLLDALDFVRYLRTTQRLKFMKLAFLLQKDNYLELPALFNLASNYCVDSIMISPLASHGSYGNEEFQDINVCDPQNPLFAQAMEAVAQAKEHHARMESSRAEIEASGRSVPDIMWRV